jgi:hypothetical protein
VIETAGIAFKKALIKAVPELGHRLDYPPGPDRPEDAATPLCVRCRVVELTKA